VAVKLIVADTFLPVVRLRPENSLAIERPMPGPRPELNSPLLKKLMLRLRPKFNNPGPHKTARIATGLDIQMPLTFIVAASGSDTIPAEMMPGTTSIILGNMGASGAALAPAMSSGWGEGAGSASGSAASISALPQLTTTTAVTGFGTVTRS
jgi:hypothetical protein